MSEDVDDKRSAEVQVTMREVLIGCQPRRLKAVVMSSAYIGALLTGKMHVVESYVPPGARVVMISVTNFGQTVQVLFEHESFSMVETDEMFYSGPVIPITAGPTVEIQSDDAIVLRDANAASR